MAEAKERLNGIMRMGVTPFLLIPGEPCSPFPPPPPPLSPRCTRVGRLFSIEFVSPSSLSSMSLTILSVLSPASPPATLQCPPPPYLRSWCSLPSLSPSPQSVSVPSD